MAWPVPDRSRDSLKELPLPARFGLGQNLQVDEIIFELFADQLVRAPTGVLIATHHPAGPVKFESWAMDTSPEKKLARRKKTVFEGVGN